jgi:hypothetical protein
MLAVTSTAGAFGFITQWAGPYDSASFASVTTDSQGDVYAVDGGADNLIEKFTSSGRLLAQWGGSGMSGTGGGTFNGATGIATDAAGSVYVTDTYDELVQKFTSSGVFVMQWGGTGRGHGMFDQPYGVITDRAGNVYVSDFKNNLIQKFTSGGVFLTQWGGRGSGHGKFFPGAGGPEGLATNAAGDVYVADPGNNLIQKFTSSGRFLTQWGGGGGTGHGQFGAGGAVDVATDRAGDVYVADENGNLIQKFTGSGGFLAQWSGRFHNPEGVATGAGGNVYVIDGGSLIYKYGPAGGSRPRCVVPNLRGKGLNAARKSLTRAGCRLGVVTPKGHTTGKVKKQSPKAGTVLRAGHKVNVEVGG